MASVVILHTILSPCAPKCLRVISYTVVITTQYPNHWCFSVQYGVQGLHAVPSDLPNLALEPDSCDTGFDHCQIQGQRCFHLVLCCTLRCGWDSRSLVHMVRFSTYRLSLQSSNRVHSNHFATTPAAPLLHRRTAFAVKPLPSCWNAGHQLDLSDVHLAISCPKYSANPSNAPIVSLIVTCEGMEGCTVP